ncbi:MAG TPA: peptidoglycan binding domain-containing protein, partial [Anaerolineales bacterium]|nr:peptidoglycan binding domain-containing protein [Anaerolineales bacterium]
YDVPVLANLIGVQRAQDQEKAEVRVALNSEGLRNLLTPVKAQVDRPAANARFIFNDETRQLELVEDSKVGRVVDLDASIAMINEALLRGEHAVPLTIVEDHPKVSGYATGQELGITELLVSETSYFYGSDIERIQNIQAAAERFHGVMVAPGEIFSMGETMGDVSLEN